MKVALASKIVSPFTQGILALKEMAWPIVKPSKPCEPSFRQVTIWRFCSPLYMALPTQSVSSKAAITVPCGKLSPDTIALETMMLYGKPVGGTQLNGWAGSDCVANNQAIVMKMTVPICRGRAYTPPTNGVA